MPRVIAPETVERILQVHKEQSDRIAPALGAEMVAANVPVAGVASLLRVTTPTVLRWMRGESTPRETYHRSIRKLTAILRRAKKERRTPLAGTYRARMTELHAIVAEFKSSAGGMEG